MKKFISVCLFSLLIISGSAYAKQSQLLFVNYGKIQDKHVKIDFFLSDSVKYKYFILKNATRLVIDLKNTQLDKKAVLKLESHPYIRKVRTSVRNAKDLRVTFDFRRKYAPVKLRLFKDENNDKHLQLNVLVNYNLDEIVAEKAVVLAPAVPKTDQEQIDDTVLSQVPDSTEEETDYFSEWDFSGKISIENLGFFHNGLDGQQHNNYVSGAIESEFYREWDNGKQSFTFVPFYRYSQHDSRRTHFDIRELTWLLAEDEWELRVGFREVYWGVTEGLHLVNIINQTDLIENNDTEDKLGQPMINLALIQDWGTLDLFVLPGFRERTFSGAEGRMRSFPEVSVGDAIYEKHGLEKHLAFAMRWSHVIGDWDIGVSHFYGTSRDPRFIVQPTATGSVKILPYYELINQTGLDLQLTHEDWIVKYEGIIRSGQGKTFYASATGIEYTMFDIFESGIDVGLVVEYMYDTRGSNNSLAPFQDDILTALRFAFNDVQSTEILAGVMFDRTNNTKFYNVEASRRLGDSFTVDLELRLFSGAPRNDPSFSVREDDHVRLEIGYHF